jgi:hypothetical protein
MILIFSYIWGIGGSFYDKGKEKNRDAFSKMMKQKFS